MHGQRRTLVLIFLLVIGVAAGSVRAQDEVLADLGFRPADDGFSFQNYTDGYAGLTAIEMERLFGDIVCESDERDEDGACELTPPAAMWMDDSNSKMIGGHCEGMAALSLALYGEMEDPAWYGGEATNELSLDESEELQREIALYWSTWGSAPSVANFDLPSTLVDILISTMSDQSEAYTLDIYMPDWTRGHAITPYAVVDQGDGIVWIMVYDNNWPGEERYVEVDLNNETWWYAASTNPDEVENLYQGDASTLTMGLTPVSGRMEIHECRFCGDADSEEAPYTGVVVNGPGARATVTDSAGHVTGMVNGKFVNEIPGAQVIHQVGGLISNQYPAVIYVPSGMQFRISVTSGGSAGGSIRASISLIRKGSVTRVSNINLDDHEDFVDVDANRIRYTSGDGGETPGIEQGLTTSGNNYRYVITGKSDMSEAGTLDFSFDPQTGEFNIGGSDDNEYIVDVDRIDADGHVLNFYTDNLEVQAGDSANLDAGEWEEGGDITGEILNEDGSVEEPFNLDDEESPEIEPGEDDPDNPDGEDPDAENPDGEDPDGSEEPADTEDDASTDESVEEDPADVDTSDSQSGTESEEPPDNTGESGE